MAIHTITRPAVLLRAEGLALLAITIVLYQYIGGNWWLFALLFLAPDLAALGYLAGKTTGSVIYNLAHTEALPAVLAVYGFLIGQPLLLGLALIWLAHIGWDRLVGYGLKYTSAFKDTHLGRV